MVTKNQPNIILLQETMGSVESITHNLKSTLKDFDFIAEYANGLSSGLSTWWNPRSIKPLGSWVFVHE